MKFSFLISHLLIHDQGKIHETLSARCGQILAKLASKVSENKMEMH
jgi:hypothetical protein